MGVKEIKTVGIKELKNNLSAYLREVRRGTRVLVADRNNVVAELFEPQASYAPDETADPILAGWLRDGIVVLPTRKKEPLTASPVRLEDGTASRWLEESRGEGKR